MESRLSISHVLSSTFGTIGANPVATLGVAFLIGVLPTQIFTYAFMGSASLNSVQLFSTSTGIALYFGLLALSIICWILVQAILVRVTVAHARDERVSIGASLATAMAKFLPLLAMTILMTLGLALGFVLLVIPGIILYILWCVASPALIAEDIGVFEALSRSQELTKGHRWKIFGLFLVITVLMWVFLAVAGVVLVTTGFATGALQSFAQGTFPVGYMIFNAVTGTLTTAVTGTLVPTLYVDLRAAREGPLTDTLADVFA